MSDEQLPPSEEPVYSRKVLEMVTVANEYCMFLEKAESYTEAQLLNFLQKISPLIYLKGALLPEIEVEDEDATEHYVSEEQWESLFNTLHFKFAGKDEFYYVDQLEKSHNDPVKGSLAECFTDIYQDLKDFLLLYQKPMKSYKENAVRECKRLFETRYGYKLSVVQQVVHALQFPGQTEDFIF